MAEDYLAQGTSAARAGNISEARRLLAKAINAAPDDERTWGRFYLVAQTDQERIDCLKQILRINPNNETAGELLKKYATPEQPVQPDKGDEITGRKIIKENPKIKEKQKIKEKGKIKEKQKITEKPKITRRDFGNDLLVRKISRFLLIFQGCALLVGIIFLLVHKISIALLIAGVALVPLLVALLWIYLRYRSYPIVNEKRRIDQHANQLQAQIIAQAANIQLNQQNLSNLEQAKENEASDALLDLQKKYIETGMRGEMIAEADIPGIDPELVQRLADHGYSSAADINNNVIYVEGFVGEKSRAIREWRDKVYFYFNGIKPAGLPDDRQEQIKKKYEVLRANYNAEIHKLEQKQAGLENARKEIQPQVDQLAPHTFLSFLRNGLAARAFMAGLIGVGIVGSPLLLGISAIVAAIRASILRRP